MDISGLGRIAGWQDLAGLIAVLSFPAIALSVFFSYYQTRLQTRLVSAEISLSALIKFYELYAEVRAMRVDLERRHQQGDQSLSKIEAMAYYNRYWVLRELEWKYFSRGLIPPATYAEWIENAMRHLDGRRNLSYFENGAAVTLKSREVFEEYVLGGLFLRSEACHAFYVRLLRLAERLEAESVPLGSDAAYAAIKRLVNDAWRRRSREAV